LSSRQIAEWIAYSDLEPHGWQYYELLHAVRCQIAAAPHRKEGCPPPELTEFMPSVEMPEMTPEEIARNLGEWKTLTADESGN